MPLTHAGPDARVCGYDWGDAREPIVVLDAKLQVAAANPAFYRAFKVSQGGTEGLLIYELSDGQWDMPRLREL